MNDSSKPFTTAEVRTLLKAADALVHTDREGNEDPRFYGRLFRVCLTFGCHPSVIPRLTSENIVRRPTERGDRYYLRWQRPKRTAKQRHIDFEVPQAYMDWLPGFLNQPKPTSRETYYWLFRRIEEQARTLGYDIPCNPRRARHTCAREQIANGMSAIDVMAGLGVTARTLDIYGLSTPEQRGAKLEAIGWGNWE